MNDQLIPHLFRTEFTKITAVLCKSFGIDHIEIAEDIASETFLSALENWTYKGIPQNPIAWLYTVAKNKARNFLLREQLFKQKISTQIKNQSEAVEELEIDLTEKNIADSQLQMMFAICHPSISVESQIGLALRILCGFGIDEIATAFLTNKDTINKRLFRAREKLRDEKVQIEYPSATEIEQRLDTVLTTLYLLYNEGYYSESNEEVLREDFCKEAMRLTALLMTNPQTDLPKVHALLSLMYFQASRFDARKNAEGEPVLYHEQDESLWDQEMITKAVYFLHLASTGKAITKYHVEASIAYWHTIKSDTEEKWENILQLYNHLLQLEYSPIAALNRTYALSKANGKQEAIAEAEKLKLENNPYYFSLLGHLYTDVHNDEAIANYKKALALAKTNADKKIIHKRLDAL
jgi:RNA polymerase sigma-70 factor (ECF subfamily)